MLRSLRLLNSGALRAMNHTRLPRSALRHRTIQWATRSGNTFRMAFAVGSTLIAEIMYDGVRCSIVTCAALSVSDGIMLTAVAPLPMTTILLPV